MMSINYVEGDLFGPLKNDETEGEILLPHVCNSKGGWGSGFVIPLGKNYPLSKEKYLKWASQKKTNPENPYCWLTLGRTQFVEVQSGKTKIHVCNMIAQTLGGSRPLYYNHLARCMDEVTSFARGCNNPRIVAPMFGSALAGGDWNFIENLIMDCWIKNDIPVTIHYLKK